ncbi:MAG: lipoprotein-releasing system ATP-binding protein LolD [Candidatus Nealsonbacteria bacterium CG10_big_fil_rev_8_21_14_0_10_36_24]|uniref:Lipoprotein-releasing system ATP-binding protein LolD n=2 Tax=Candidatus Nealsoniibacteriota TaxID=1817911 RepID=A0A2H0YMT9_9BACT|nr:MAG: lipoprotein-releasing system ATP-binding protein LolD [Candidatus Nealsonbacteria bacterium CG10_big_fil_rev_8_21_14_0_10_36_24]PIS39814.1 MAG: lipoprotein-releasing system ATP-binding protein LolD [Candidatus Nealsonbacteria bacterium CG08_land_8_20_14_0_20_36_22]
MAEPLIKLENIWKIYQLGEVELNVLRGVSLEINPGDFVTLMGPSGSGKSTLLQIIGCLDVPTKGKVFLAGEDVSRMTEDELAQIRGQRIGFVFQQFNLLHNLNALENVMLPMVFQGVAENKRIERAKNLLNSLNLGKRIFHKPTELSGGEQQRIAIARSLANDPEVIVADEPTGNLDSFTGKMIMDILIELHKKENKTIVVVTHDPNIAGYSEQVINIKDGQIVSNHLAKEKVLWGK